LRLKFAQTLRQDVLWAYCAVECVTYWHGSKEVRDIATQIKERDKKNKHVFGGRLESIFQVAKN